MSSSFCEFCTWTCVVLTATIASPVCWTVAAGFLYGLPSPEYSLEYSSLPSTFRCIFNGLNIPAAATAQANLSAPRSEERGTKMTPHVLRPVLNGDNPGFLTCVVAFVPPNSPLPVFSPGLVSRFEPLVAKLKLPLSVKYPIAALLSTRLY